jgi:hypothetical protein
MPADLLRPIILGARLRPPGGAGGENASSSLMAAAVRSPPRRSMRLTPNGSFARALSCTASNPFATKMSAAC